MRLERSWLLPVGCALVLATLGSGCADAPADNEVELFCQLDRCDLLVSEVLAAPKSGGGLQEYVELYNPGNRDLDLRGCTIQLIPGDGRPKRHLIPEPDSPDDPGPLKVPAGGYLLLGPEDADPNRVAYRWRNLGNLPNSSTKGVHRIELLDGSTTRTVITRVSYLAPDPAEGLGAPTSGLSFQLGAEVATCPESESWDAWCLGDAEDGDDNRGTPGRANTRCVLPRCKLGPCDVLITELMPNPAGADGPNEYVELHNPGAEAVSLAFCGLQLQKGEEEPVADVLRWPDPERPLEIPAGGFVVIRSPLPGDADPEPGVLRWDELGNLPNSSAAGPVSVRLMSVDGDDEPVVVSEVVYLGQQEGVGVGELEEGQAFQLNAETFICEPEDQVWCLASTPTEGDDLGTPGEANEICPWVPPPRVCPLTRPHEVIINELLADPSTDDQLNEYIELYNGGTEPIDLSGCVLQLARGQGESERVAESWTPADGAEQLSQVLIPAGGFLLLAPPDAQVDGCASANWDEGFGALPNSSASDAITLRLMSKPEGAVESFVVSGFTYLAPEGVQGVGAPVTGASFELFPDTLAECVDGGACEALQDPANWGVAETEAGENRGTPCGPNGLRPPPTPSCVLTTANELIITEVLADPRTDDPLNEYIELYNPTDAPLDLRGCDLQLLKGDPATAEPATHRIRNRVADAPIAVPAGGHLLLVPPDAAPEGCAVYAWQDLGNLPNSTSNKPVTLRLVSEPEGGGEPRVITSFAYLHEDDQPGLGGPRSGASFQLCLEVLEECTLEGSCDALSDPESWGFGVRDAGENRGSPCADNSDCWRCVPWSCAGEELDKRLPTPPGPCDVVITEVYADAPSDLGNERDLEWFEMVNVADTPVDLRGLGLHVRAADREPDYVFEDGLHCFTLPPGCRVQVLSNPDPLVNGGYESLFDYDGDFSLRNSDGYLALRLPPVDGVEGPPVLVDAIEWEDTRPGESVNLGGECPQTCDGNDEVDCLCLMAPSPEQPNDACPLVEPGECLDPVSGEPREIVTPRVGELLIVEVLPSGGAGEGGFVELYGVGDRTVDLNALRLQVNFGEPETLGIAGVTCAAVAPGERALLGQRIDEGDEPGDYDATFVTELPAGRLEVWLRPPGGVSDIDAASFDDGPGAGLAHVLSEAELREGGRWCAAAPTPGEVNPVCPLTCDTPGDDPPERPVVLPEPGQIRFTEVLNNPEGVDSGAEWIELAVAYGGPVDVNELMLSVNGDDPEPLLVRHGICTSGVAGNRFLLVQDPEEAGERLGFDGNLTNQNLELALYLPDGETLIDATGPLQGDPGSGVAWTLHEEEGGLGDSWCTGVPTPRGVNPACPPPPPRCVDGPNGPERDVQAPGPCDVLFSEVRVNADDDQPTAWIELTALGDDAVDLNGLLLQVGDGQPEPLLAGDECVTVATDDRALLVQSLVPEDNGGVEGGVLTFAARLTGEELRLRLLSADGLTLVDEAVLPAGLPAPGEAAAVGEQTLDCARNDSPPGWCTLAQTPGEPNPGCPLQCTEADGSRRAVRPLVAGQVLLTEVHNNPVGVDGDKEWIELLVQAGEPADLNGLHLSINGDDPDELVVLGGGRCRAVVEGERLLLVQDADPLVNGGIGGAAAVFDGTLTNTGLVVTLFGSDAATEIDRVSLADDPGAAMSWARHEDGDGLGDGWCVAVPSAGAANAACPDGPGPDPEVPPGHCLPDGADEARPFMVPGAGDVIFSELVSNPAGDDAGREWLELYVVGAGPFDLNGLLLQVGAAAQPTELVAPSTACVTVSAGDWVLLAQGDNPAENGGLPAPALVFASALPDSDLDLRLLGPAGGLVDGLDYPAPTVEGAALQLDTGALDALNNDNPLSWCTVQAPGSPGAENGACAG